MASPPPTQLCQFRVRVRADSNVRTKARVRVGGAARRLQHGRAAVMRKSVDSQASVRDLCRHLTRAHVQVATN